METLSISDDGAVRVVEMDRPEALNAFNTRLIDDLADAFLDAARDPRVKVLVLTGAGRALKGHAGTGTSQHGGRPQARRRPWQTSTSFGRKHGTPGPATSIFKMYGTELQQRKSSLFVALRGTRGFGWTGEAFTEQELEGTRTFLGERATSIYSGSNEIQRNIIAKRVLGLPD